MVYKTWGSEIKVVVQCKDAKRKIAMQCEEVRKLHHYSRPEEWSEGHSLSVQPNMKIVIITELSLVEGEKEDGIPLEIHIWGDPSPL